VFLHDGCMDIRFSHGNLLGFDIVLLNLIMGDSSVYYSYCQVVKSMMFNTNKAFQSETCN